MGQANRNRCCASVAQALQTANAKANRRCEVAALSIAKLHPQLNTRTVGQSHSHTVTQSAVRNPLYMQTGASASMSNANPHPKSRSKVTQPAAVGDYRMNLSNCTHTSPCAVISDMPPDHMRKSVEIWLNYLPNLNLPVFMRLNLSLVRFIWNRKVVEWVFPFSLLSTSHTLSRSLSISVLSLYCLTYIDIGQVFSFMAPASGTFRLWQVRKFCLT